MGNTLTQRKHAPFRYDIVGSFLRPETLKSAREAFAKNEISAAQLTEVEDACIRNLVEKQLEAGLKSVTDGEFRRSYWHLDFMWGFDGIEHNVKDIFSTEKKHVQTLQEFVVKLNLHTIHSSITLNF